MQKNIINYRIKNKEKINKQIKKYNKENHEEIKARKRKFNKENRDKINKYTRIKRRNDLSFKLHENMSRAFRTYLKSMNTLKNNKSISIIITYSFEELVKHIESKFYLNMTLENHGTVWHIDHIVPLSYFKCKTIFDPLLKIAWSLDNLRPLDAKKNIRKGNKILDIPETKAILKKIEEIKNSYEYKKYLEDLANGVYDKYLIDKKK